MRRGTQPPMDDDLRKCFRSLLQRVEFESLCCRKKIEESERVRRRIREEREAERPPQLRGHDRVRQYVREEREVERPTPSRSAPRAAPTRPASTGRGGQLGRDLWHVHHKHSNGTHNLLARPLCAPCRCSSGAGCSLDRLGRCVRPHLTSAGMGECGLLLLYQALAAGTEELDPPRHHACVLPPGGE